MKWKVGDTVIAIKEKYTSRVMVNDIHIIQDIDLYKCKCTPAGRIILQINKRSNGMPVLGCDCEGSVQIKNDGHVWLHESFFKPYNEFNIIVNKLITGDKIE